MISEVTAARYSFVAECPAATLGTCLSLTSITSKKALNV